MNKSISTIVSAVLIVAIALSLTSSAYIWGIPLIGKRQEASVTEKVYNQFSQNNANSLPKIIEDVANNRGVRSFTINEDGIWKLNEEEDSIEFTFVTKTSNIAANTEFPISLTSGVQCGKSRTIPTTPQTIAIPLNNKFNLISLPVTPPDTAIATIIADIADKINVISYWDPVKGWLLYDVTTAQFVTDSFSLEPGKGYIFRMKEVSGAVQTADLVITGIPYKFQPITLVATKWYMIGAPYADVKLSDVLGTCNLGNIELSTIDPSTVANIPIIVDSDTVLSSGKGYWIRSTNDCILKELEISAVSPPNGTLGQDSSSAVCAQANTQEDFFSITYKIFFRELYDNPFSDTASGFKIDLIKDPTGLKTSTGKTVKILFAESTQEIINSKTLIIKKIKILLI